MRGSLLIYGRLLAVEGGPRCVSFIDKPLCLWRDVAGSHVCFGCGNDSAALLVKVSLTSPSTSYVCVGPPAVGCGLFSPLINVALGYAASGAGLSGTFCRVDLSACLVGSPLDFLKNSVGELTGNLVDDRGEPLGTLCRRPHGRRTFFEFILLLFKSGGSPWVGDACEFVGDGRKFVRQPVPFGADGRNYVERGD